MSDLMITPDNLTQLREHPVHMHKAVKALSFSPDSRYIAVISGDNAPNPLSLWHTETGKRIRVLSKSAQTAPVFSPDGSVIYVLERNVIAVYATESGALLTRLTEHKAWITDLALHPSGHLLASSSVDATIRVWDTTDHRLLHTLEHAKTVSNIAFTGNGRYLVAAVSVFGAYPRYNFVNVWDTATWQRISELKIDDEIWQLAANPAVADLIAMSFREEKPKNWDAQNFIQLYRVVAGELQTVLSPLRYENYVTRLTFSAHGKLLAAVTSDSGVHIIDPNTMSVIGSWEQPFVNGVVFSDDNTWMATHVSYPTEKNDPSTIQLLSLRQPAVQTARVAGKKRDAVQWSHLAELTGHTRPVDSVDFSPDSTCLASGSADGTFRLWQLASGQSTAFNAGGAVIALDYHPKQTHLALLDNERRVQIWQLVDHQSAVYSKTLAQVDLNDQTITYHPSGNSVVAGIKFLDTQTGTRGRSFSGHGAPYNGAALSNDGHYFAVGVGGDTGYSGSVDDNAKVYETGSGQLLVELPHDLYVYSVRFSPDGRLLATITLRSELRVWDWRAKSIVLEARPNINSVMFNPDGQMLALAGRKGTIHFLNVPNFSQEKQFADTIRGLKSVRFSPDGRYFAAFGGKTINLWRAGEIW